MFHQSKTRQGKNTTVPANKESGDFLSHIVLENFTENMNLHIQRICLTSRLILRRNIWSRKSESSTETKNEEVASFVDVEEAEETKPESFFNKSRLLPAHRRMLMNETPYDEPQSWIHLTEKYQRKMYGKYGSQSNVDPRICFPTSQALADRREFESVAYPFTLSEMMQKVKLDQEAKKQAILKREQEIGDKMAKLEQWKADLRNKIAKKESDALAAKQKKDRMIEEVRRHFGFNVDPKDERFKEMLQQKEKEDKKKMKEAKRKQKEEKMMAKLIDKTAGASNEVKAADKPIEEAK